MAKVASWTTLVGLCLVGLVWAQERESSARRSPEALEILSRADAALRAVDSMRYDVRTRPEGVAADYVGPANGTAVLAGWSGSIPRKFRIHVETTVPGSERPTELTVGGNGKGFFLIDHGRKKAWLGTSLDFGEAVDGVSAVVAAMFELVRDAPFADELNAVAIELQGAETVDGEACHKIYAIYRGGRAASTWFISKKDLLPRRQIRHFDLPGGPGAFDLVIGNLETNPELGAELFELQLPEGYEQVGP